MKKKMLLGRIKDGKRVPSLTYLLIQALTITGNMHKKLTTLVTIFGERDYRTDGRGKQFHTLCM